MNHLIDSPRFEAPTHLNLRLADHADTLSGYISECAAVQTGQNFASIPMEQNELLFATVLAQRLTLEPSGEVNKAALKATRYAKMFDTILHKGQIGQLISPTMVCDTTIKAYVEELLTEQPIFDQHHPLVADQVETDQVLLADKPVVAIAGQCALIGLAAAERQHNQLVMARIFAGID